MELVVFLARFSYIRCMCLWNSSKGIGDLIDGGCYVKDINLYSKGVPERLNNTQVLPRHSPNMWLVQFHCVQRNRTKKSKYSL